MPSRPWPGTRPGPSYLLDAMADTLPPDLWLTRLEEQGQQPADRGHDLLLSRPLGFHGESEGLRAIQGRGSRSTPSRTSASRRARSPSRCRAGSRSEPWPSSIRSRTLRSTRRSRWDHGMRDRRRALGYFLLVSPKQIERDALRAQGEQVRAELTQAQALEEPPRLPGAGRCPAQAARGRPGAPALPRGRSRGSTARSRIWRCRPGWPWRSSLPEPAEEKEMSSRFRSR